MWRIVLFFSWLFSSMMPQLAWAEGAGGGYKGIATLYYMIIAVVLSYGAYDIFGKKIAKFAAPIIFIVMYLLIPDV